MQNADKINKWLETHPAINRSKIAEAVGITPAYFHMLLNGKKPLHDEMYSNIRKELRKYGYQ